MRLFAVLVFAFSPAFLHAADGSVRYVRQGDETVATIVASDVALVHTGQVMSDTFTDERLSMIGGDDNQIVKLNVTAATQEAADRAREFIRSKYPAASRPPVSYVVGALPGRGEAAFDVVAVSKGNRPYRSGSSAMLPPGPRVYISGQAEKGATPAEAAAKTIASLVKTLEFVGSSPDQAVQARCFLTPMSAASDVRGEFEKVFGKDQLPLVFVEWKSDLPIEIELIAAAPPAAENAPAIEYLTPPEMKPSPVFARVVRINRGDVVYTAGLYSEKPGSGQEQVLSIFDQLQSILKRTNGDLKHLAKATYYVSDADASGKLNEIRPKFYDPQRPPAASKAMVNGVGMKDRSITLDMIGVVALPPMDAETGATRSHAAQP